MKTRHLAAGLALVALTASARADEVVTKAGTSYGGKIVAEDALSVTVDSPALGRMKIARAEIAGVKRDADPAPPPASADGEKPSGPTEAEIASAAAAAAAKHAAEAEASAAEAREALRRSAKLVRRTESRTTKPAADASAAASPEAKATVGGAQLAQVERGSMVVIFQPPKQFEAAPAGIQIGRRIFARLESAGLASACIAIPTAGEEQQIVMRLADVQRHAVVKTGASRLRMIEGIDRGSWLRVRLDDGTFVQGVLQEAQPGALILARLSDDGTAAETQSVAESRVVEMDGLMRSTVTRLTLAEVPCGERLALTMWPDAREIVGTVKDRSELFVLVESADGTTTRVPVDGPVAEVRRIPQKWREVAAALAPGRVAHVNSADDLADVRLEFDLVGTVVALTPHAITLDTADGLVAVPFDSITSLAPAMTDAEASGAKAMKASEKGAGLPFLPGAAASRAQGLDPATGVSAVTDGTLVRNVFVTAPFTGEVFGIRVGDRIANSRSVTDLHFDTVVLPRQTVGAAPNSRRAEMISNSLEGMRVTLELDDSGLVSTIEIGAR